MSERDELAEVLWDLALRHLGVATSSSKHMADELLAAGYRRPRTVTTVEELDALPRWSVVRDRAGYVGQRFPGGWRTLVVEPRSSPWLTDTLEDVALPATVLHEPEATK